MADDQEELSPIESLFKAIHEANIDDIKDILDRNPDILNTKHRTNYGWGLCTPLMEACFNESSKKMFIKILCNYY